MQGVDELIFDIPDLQIARDLHEHGAQIELRLLPVKAGQALDQRRRNDQNRIGVTKRVANEQPGPVFHRRWHEVEIVTQTRQRLA